MLWTHMSYKKWCEAVILIVSTLWCHLVYIRPWCYTHFVYLHRSVMVRLWQLLLEVPSIIIHKQVGTHMKNIPRELFFHSCTMNEPCNVCHWVTLTSLICNSQGNSMLALPTNSLQTWPQWPFDLSNLLDCPCMETHWSFDIMGCMVWAPWMIVLLPDI